MPHAQSRSLKHRHLQSFEPAFCSRRLSCFPTRRESQLSSAETPSTGYSTPGTLPAVSSASNQSLPTPPRTFISSPDHGNEYTLQLEEVSSDADSHFDSKVFLLPGDKAAKDRLTEMPVFVPAAELEKAKQEAAAAKAAQTAEVNAEAVKAEAYRSQYPGSLHFDYTWDTKKAKELGLQQIWRDDKFTYVRGQFQETPVLYELKDGKGSLINFDYNAGLYTVPKRLDNGYLAIGKKRVDFHRTFHGNGENN